MAFPGTIVLRTNHIPEPFCRINKNRRELNQNFFAKKCREFRGILNFKSVKKVVEEILELNL